MSGLLFPATKMDSIDLQMTPWQTNAKPLTRQGFYSDSIKKKSLKKKPTTKQF